MHDLPGSLHPALDLSRYTEATRRELYDRIVLIQFPPATPYEPDAAGLLVFHAFGRWFGTWVDLEAPEDWPEGRRRELVRIEPAPDAPEGIMLYEV
ncbi:MAG TPA: hypothetical protein VLT87_20045 [Thermoanaerobaculia bacterium]|nr:hypothetical protein [Thermoanaerobaculia bacterium]